MVSSLNPGSCAQNHLSGRGFHSKISRRFWNGIHGQRVEAPSGDCTTPSQPWNLPGRGFYSKISRKCWNRIHGQGSDSVLEWAQIVGFGNVPGHNLAKVSAIWAQDPNFHISFSRSFLVWAQKNIVDGQNSISKIEKWKTQKWRVQKHEIARPHNLTHMRAQNFSTTAPGPKFRDLQVPKRSKKPVFWGPWDPKKF